MSEIDRDYIRELDHELRRIPRSPAHLPRGVEPEKYDPYLVPERGFAGDGIQHMTLARAKKISRNMQFALGLKKHRRKTVVE